ncbi:MAG: MBL fold metallo-hydrolase [Caldilineaceae bacterium]
MPGQISQITPNLFIHHGGCNVGILRAGARALLLECDDGAVQHELPALGITHIDWILCTHHHRDSAASLTQLAGPHTQIGVPAAERQWFEEVERFWYDPQMRWHLYNTHPHNLMLADSVPVHRAFAEGDQLHFGDAHITALETPGHTDGSLTYLVEVDGQRVAFCGDAIYAEGQLWDVYSLQKGNETITDYHGFLGDYPRLLAGLGKVLAARPNALVPTHGVIMHNPARAVDLLHQRLDQCYDRYAAISALRYYFPAMFAAYAGRPGHMPIRQGIAVPDFLRHVGTSWIVIAENGEALVMDCGSPQVIEALHAWQTSGEITRLPPAG